MPVGRWVDSQHTQGGAFVRRHIAVVVLPCYEGPVNILPRPAPPVFVTRLRRHTANGSFPQTLPLMPACRFCCAQQSRWRQPGPHTCGTRGQRCHAGAHRRYPSHCCWLAPTRWTTHGPTAGRCRGFWSHGRPELSCGRQQQRIFRPDHVYPGAAAPT